MKTLKCTAGFLLYLCVHLVHLQAFAQPSDGHDQSITTQTNAREKTADELDSLLTSDVYSDKKTVQIPKKVPEKPLDLSWLAKLLNKLANFGQAISQTVGILGKVIAILLLALLAWILYQKRHVWLKVFSRIHIHAHSSAKMTIITEQHDYQALWQSLPPKHEFLSTLQNLLKNQQWLLALGLLYQGTLREMAQVHELPIDNHQTEEECLWLLYHAKKQNSQEKQYFEELVTLWRASAYGKKVPDSVAKGDYSVILRLMSAWSSIYGQRGR